MPTQRGIRIGLLCALAPLALAGCSTTEQSSSTTMTRQHVCTGEEKSYFVHCVFFTLKPETTPEQAQELIDGCKTLKQVPSVRRLDVGLRHPEMKRDVNVLDYEIGLVVYFDDKAGHDLYNTHPIHNAMVDKHKGKWNKVRVFDYTSK